LVSCIGLVALSGLLPQIATATGKLLQVGTLSALSAGVYDGSTTLGPIQRPDAYGLGTFDRLDGEMIVMSGVIFRVGSDGRVTKPVNTTTIPFAAISQLDTPDASADVTATTGRAAFEKLVMEKLQSANYPALVVFDGKFSAVRTRSVPAQQKPYPTLAEVCSTQQKEFDLGPQEGTLVGFFCPQWMAGINAPGMHLHFLNSDHSAGGHVLDFTIESGVLRIQTLTGVQVLLPGVDSAYAESDIAPTSAGSAEK
ncbi:MAG TPA: acetolactate decarboxylase, partial [Opitutales bacterium]|nr:acetolactate decarboxylase [Opitutales bacterium]